MIEGIKGIKRIVISVLSTHSNILFRVWQQKEMVYDSRWQQHRTWHNCNVQPRHPVSITLAMSAAPSRSSFRKFWNRERGRGGIGKSVNVFTSIILLFSFILLPVFFISLSARIFFGKGYKITEFRDLTGVYSKVVYIYTRGLRIWQCYRG